MNKTTFVIATSQYGYPRELEFETFSDKTNALARAAEIVTECVRRALESARTSDTDEDSDDEDTSGDRLVELDDEVFGLDDESTSLAKIQKALDEKRYEDAVRLWKIFQDADGIYLDDSADYLYFEESETK